MWRLDNYIKNAIPMIFTHFMAGKMPLHGPRSRNSRYMVLVSNKRQQQELACLHRPAKDASAVLFDENPKDPTLFLTPYESWELAVVTVEGGERGAVLEERARTVQVPFV